MYFRLLCIILLGITKLQADTFDDLEETKTNTWNNDITKSNYTFESPLSKVNFLSPSHSVIKTKSQLVGAVTGPFSEPDFLSYFPIEIPEKNCRVLKAQFQAKYRLGEGNSLTLGVYRHTYGLYITPQEGLFGGYVFDY